MESVLEDSGESMATASRAQRVDVFARALEREGPGCTLLTEVEDVAPYECDGLAAYRQLPLGVVLAESEAQVQGVLRICAHLGVPVVPRGAGTGLSGGAMPIHEGVVLSLARMRKIIAVDPYSRTATLQPGVRNLAISEAAAPYGLYYAPDPSSQVACTIGEKPSPISRRTIAAISRRSILPLPSQVASWKSYTPFGRATHTAKRARPRK